MLGHAQSQIRNPNISRNRFVVQFVPLSLKTNLQTPQPQIVNPSLLQSKKKWPGNIQPHIVDPRVSYFQENVRTLSVHAQPQIVNPNVWDLFGITWAHLHSLGIIKDHLGQLSGTVSDHLESSGMILDHLNSCGLIWDHLGWFAIIWDPPECRGIIWASFENFDGQSWRTVEKIWGSGVPEVFEAMISLHFN